MFISLPFSACPPSLTCQSTNVGPSALRDDGVERVTDQPAGAKVETADITEVAGFLEVAFNESHMAPVIQPVPDLDRLRRKTAIGECDRQRCTDLEHPTDFAQYLHGPGQVIYRDADSNPVELCLSERQFGVRVQVLDDVGVEPLVAAQLHLVHAEPDHTPVFDLGRKVADPTAHEVEELSSGRKQLPVQLRDRRDCGFVYVRDEPGRPVELLVRRLVGPPENILWKP